MAESDEFPFSSGSDSLPWADPADHGWKYQHLADPEIASTPPFSTQIAAEQSRPDRNFSAKRRAAVMLAALAPSLFFCDIPAFAEPIDLIVQPDPLPASRPIDLGYLESGILFVPTARTRLYLPSTGAPAISPAYGAWDVSGGADRRKMVTTPISSAMTAKGIVDAIGEIGKKHLWRQYVSDIVEAQTIGGTFKGQLRVSENDAGMNHDRVTILLKVVSNDGSAVRGTLLALNFYGNTNEYSLEATRTNRKLADGDALSSVVAQSGDRIVIEIGTQPSVSPTVVDGTATAVFGDDAGADLGEDETTTAANNPWIEFSQELRFAAAPPEVDPVPWTFEGPTFDPSGREYLAESFLLEMDRSLPVFVQPQPDTHVAAARDDGAHLDPYLSWHPDLAGLTLVDLVLEPPSPPQFDPAALGYLLESFAFLANLPPPPVPDFGWYVRANEPFLLVRAARQAAIARMPWLFVHELPIPVEPAPEPAVYTRCPDPETEYSRRSPAQTEYARTADSDFAGERVVGPTTEYEKRIPPQTDYDRCE